MDEPFGFIISVDQAAYDRLQEPQKQQLQADLKAAIQTVQSKYNSLNLTVQNQHELAHRR